MVRAFCGTLAWRRSMLRLYVHGVHHRPSLYTFLGITVIPKARHPDVRKASARSHQRASRTEGSCVCLFSNPTVFLKCHSRFNVGPTKSVLSALCGRAALYRPCENAKVKMTFSGAHRTHFKCECHGRRKFSRTNDEVAGLSGVAPTDAALGRTLRIYTGNPDNVNRQMSI